MAEIEALSDPELIETYNILLEEGKPLTLKYVFQKLVDKGLLRNDPRVEARYWTSITDHGHIFTSLSSLGHAAIGLKEWTPYRKKRIKKRKTKYIDPVHDEKIFSHSVDNRKKVKKYIYSHKLTQEEIKESFLSISSKLLEHYKFRGEGFPLTVYCYEGLSFNVWVNSEYKSIHSPELAKFYKENDLKKGDIVRLEKKEDDPIGIYLFKSIEIAEVIEPQVEQFPINHDGDKKIIMITVVIIILAITIMVFICLLMIL